METTNYERKGFETEINLGEIFQKLLDWLWVIVLSTGIFAIAALLISMFYLTPIYKSSSTVYVLNTNNPENAVTYSEVQIASLLTHDYEQLIKSREVLETTINELGLNSSISQLASNIQVEAATDSRILTITVSDSDPYKAQNIANKVREISAKQIEQIMNIDAVNLVDEAFLPTSQSSPNVKKNTVLGALIGFILACAVIIISHILNDHINSTEDVERYLELSVLGVIPLDKEAVEEEARRRKMRHKK